MNLYIFTDQHGRTRFAGWRESNLVGFGEEDLTALLAAQWKDKYVPTWSLDDWHSYLSDLMQGT